MALECGFEFGWGLAFGGEGGVLPFEAEFGEAAGDGALVSGVAESLEGFVFYLGEGVLEFGVCEGGVELALGEALNAGAVKSVGAEESCLGRDEDGFHFQSLGDVAGVEGTGATEGEEGVVGGIGSVANGDGADGVGHLFDGDFEKAGEEGGIELVAGEAGFGLEGDGGFFCGSDVFPRSAYDIF